MKITVYAARHLSQKQLSAWAELQQGHFPLDNPFFHPEFTRAVAALRPNIEVAVIENAHGPQGFFPFERVGRSVGRPVASIMSDMHGVIMRPDLELDALSLIRACGLTTWHFDHLPASQSMFRPFHYFLDDSPYLDLRGGFAAYAEPLDARGSTLKQARRKMRKIEREVGPLRFELHCRDAAVFAALVAWKQQQLLAGNYFNVFRHRWLEQLLLHLCAHHTPGFAGWLSALYAGDQLMAVHLGLRSHGVLSSWIPTYNPEYAKYSPGLILHLEMAKSAAEKGITRLDLCRGENRLKKALMSGAFPVAIGAVDVPGVNRLMRSIYYRTRALVQNTPLRGAPLQAYRRVRNWVWSRFMEPNVSPPALPTGKKST